MRSRLSTYPNGNQPPFPLHSPSAQPLFDTFGQTYEPMSTKYMDKEQNLEKGKSLINVHPFRIHSLRHNEESYKIIIA